MTPRTNQADAMLIDLAVILLPLVGPLEAARMLVDRAIPLRLAVRALASSRRRAIYADMFQPSMPA
jgi:hypothetical protein